MRKHDVQRRLRRREETLRQEEERLGRLVSRHTELGYRGAPGGMRMRCKLEIMETEGRVNDLRTQIWGLKQLNLPG